MTDAFFFRVDGTPRPQPRPRKVNGCFVSIVDKKVALWRIGIESTCRRAVNGRRDMPLTGALRMQMLFSMPTSKSERWGQPHTIKPDGDNLAKAVADAVERAGAIANDCTIAEWKIEKVWARDGSVAAVIEQIATPQRQSVDLGSRQPPPWLTRS